LPPSVAVCNGLPFTLFYPSDNLRMYMQIFALVL
jgi:hypothetical protein